MTLNHNNTPHRTWFLHWWVLGGWWARLLFNVTCTCVPQYWTFFLLTSQGAWSNCAALLVVFMFTLCNFYHTFKWPNIPSTDTSTSSSSATFPPPSLHIWQQRVGGHECECISQLAWTVKIFTLDLTWMSIRGTSLLCRQEYVKWTRRNSRSYCSYVALHVTDALASGWDFDSDYQWEKANRKKYLHL